MDWRLDYDEAGWLLAEVRGGIDLHLVPSLLMDVFVIVQAKKCSKILLALHFPASTASILDLKIDKNISKTRRSIQKLRMAVWRPQEYGATPATTFDFIRNFFGNPSWEIARFETKEKAMAWLLEEEREPIPGSA
jgi:hypothetical protein